jgi:peptidoglycan lytic transglycosylase
MGRLLSILILASGTALAANSPGSALEMKEGLASYYGRSFHGRITASGVPLDNDAMVAAHPVFAFGTFVRVTNIGNGRSVEVWIVDRGPARGPRTDGVIIDVSRAAARALGFLERGRTRVRVEVLGSPES